MSYSLVMREWVDINPGTEYRVWVEGGRVLAISQRDTANFYPHMQREQESIVRDIQTFNQEQVAQEKCSQCALYTVWSFA